MTRTLSRFDPLNPIFDSQSLDPNIPRLFLDEDLPPNPLRGWGPPSPLNRRQPSPPELPPLPELPKTLWPDGSGARNANDVVREDFSALLDFGRYRQSFLPSGYAAGSVALFIPSGSLPGGPLTTPGATQGVGYVGSVGAPPIPFIRAAPQSAPGGLPGLLIEAGPGDPLNPDAPLPGGLVGLLREYLRDNSRGSN